MGQQRLTEAQVAPALAELRSAFAEEKVLVGENFLYIPTDPTHRDAAQEVLQSFADKNLDMMVYDEERKSLVVFFDPKVKGVALEASMRRLEEGAQTVEVARLTEVINLRQEYQERVAQCISERIGKSPVQLSAFTEAEEICVPPLTKEFEKKHDAVINRP